MKKIICISVASLLCLIIVYSVFWFYQASHIEKLVAARLQEYNIKHDSLLVHGFPFKYEFSVKNPRLSLDVKRSDDIQEHQEFYIAGTLNCESNIQGSRLTLSNGGEVHYESNHPKPIHLMVTGDVKQQFKGEFFDILHPSETISTAILNRINTATLDLQRIKLKDLVNDIDIASLENCQIHYQCTQESDEKQMLHLLVNVKNKDESDIHVNYLCEVHALTPAWTKLAQLVDADTSGFENVPEFSIRFNHQRILTKADVKEKDKAELQGTLTLENVENNRQALNLKIGTNYNFSEISLQKLKGEIEAIDPKAEESAEWLTIIKSPKFMQIYQHIPKEAMSSVNVQVNYLRDKDPMLILQDLKVNADVELLSASKAGIKAHIVENDQGIESQITLCHKQVVLQELISIYNIVRDLYYENTVDENPVKLASITPEAKTELLKILGEFDESVEQKSDDLNLTIKLDVLGLTVGDKSLEELLMAFQQYVNTYMLTEAGN